jgi:hypothetical protein
MLGSGTRELHVPARDRGSDEIRAGLDAVRHHLVARACKPLDTLNMDRVGAGALDLRTHGREERGQLADLRLARGVFDDGLAGRAYGGHHEVLGARDGDRVEHEPCAM